MTVSLRKWQDRIGERVCWDCLMSRGGDTYDTYGVPVANLLCHCCEEALCGPHFLYHARQLDAWQDRKAAELCAVMIEVIDASIAAGWTPGTVDTVIRLGNAYGYRVTVEELDLQWEWDDSATVREVTA